VEFVGHLGCSGRLVKIATARDEHPKWNEVAVVDPCPACGGEHRTRPMWREARPGEAAEAEVTV
jgi:hypothetical protein